MLSRCYGKRTKSIRRNYVDCFVCDDWLYFSKFKAWMEQQDWEGKHLDKDIIEVGNKEYCPDKCAFVLVDTNSFVTDSGKSRGDYPIGVSLNKGSKRYRSIIRYKNTNRHLGYFDTVEEAHLAWKKAKCSIANILAEAETDVRIKAALIERYK